MTSRPNPKAFMYLALGTVAIGGGLCYFQYTKLGEVKARVAKLRSEVSDPGAVKTRLDQSNLQLEGAKQSLVHLEANVSSAAYVPSLLRDLDGYGKQNGIAVTGVRPAQKKAGEDDAKARAKRPYDELNIQVTGTGTFDSIQNFVTNLAKFPKIVAARMVSIEPARASGPSAKPGLLNMTVQLKAYVFKQDASQAVGAPASATPATTTSGVATPPTGGTATPASAAAPAKGVPATTGAPTPAAKATPVVKQPTLTGKTALARAGRVRVEG